MVVRLVWFASIALILFSKVPMYFFLIRFFSLRAELHDRTQKGLEVEQRVLVCLFVAVGIFVIVFFSFPILE